MHAESIAGFDAFVVKDFLSREECEVVLADAERAGFERNGEKVMFAGNRLRATVTAAKWADVLWKRLSGFAAPRLHDAAAGRHSFNGPAPSVPTGVWTPVTVSDFFRVSRYPPGGCFTPHVDTCYARDDGYVGMYTMLIYLNDAFEGGETALFGDAGVRHDVVPETGMALVFYHHVTHAGLTVRSGVKHCLRTEVVYALQRSSVILRSPPALEVGDDEAVGPLHDADA